MAYQPMSQVEAMHFVNEARKKTRPGLAHREAGRFPGAPLAWTFANRSISISGPLLAFKNDLWWS